MSNSSASDVPPASDSGTAWVDPNFSTTNWSLVLEVLDTAPGRALGALERLCARYWFPVYAFIRRRGNDVHLAEDLTQGFFEFAIERRLLGRAQPERGRFRNFLLTSLDNFLHNQHDRATAAKRGGRHQIVPLDEAEEILARQPAGGAAPGDSFDRHWALTLVRHVMEHLHAEFTGRGRAAVCDALQPYLTGEPAAGDYARIAAGLGMEPGALKVALHRMRQRFGELLRREVAYTVADPADVEDEIRHLLAVLAHD
jgi:RNA polymerase sigma-70 factor (ECF subfamily)